MTVLQQAQLYVDQLRREAGKQRINVSDAINDMKVILLGLFCVKKYFSGVCDSDSV